MRPDCGVIEFRGGPEGKKIPSLGESYNNETMKMVPVSY